MQQHELEKYKSCFDVIGPVMIGPSSSHTAGALRMGNIVRAILADVPRSVTIHYYESFAETHKGHGTDFALVGGLLEFTTDDDRVPFALEHAARQGLTVEFIEEDGSSPVHHPNTADITLRSATKTVRLIASSIGGGTVAIHHIELEQQSVELRGPLPVILFIARDEAEIVRLKYTLMEGQMQIGAEQRLAMNNKTLAVFELDVLLTEPIKAVLRSLYAADRLIILE